MSEPEAHKLQEQPGSASAEPANNAPRSAASVGDFRIEQPKATQAAAVHALIERCPPLDHNSLYCNMLQCEHFAGTSAIARRDDETFGFISGYLIPEDPHILFVWQVAVDARARGAGLAVRLIRHILERPVCAGVRCIHTTVTPDNGASRTMFSRLATSLDTTLSVVGCYDRRTHFNNTHDSEELLAIGPFAPLAPSTHGEISHVQCSC